MNTHSVNSKPALHGARHGMNTQPQPKTPSATADKSAQIERTPEDHARFRADMKRIADERAHAAPSEISILQSEEDARRAHRADRFVGSLPAIDTTKDGCENLPTGMEKSGEAPRYFAGEFELYLNKFTITVPLTGDEALDKQALWHRAHQWLSSPTLKRTFET